MKPCLHIAIPAMDEVHYLPSTMADLLSQESIYAYRIYICVNQPESYWQEKPEVCQNNQKTIAQLQALNEKHLKSLSESIQQSPSEATPQSSSEAKPNPWCSQCKSICIIDRSSRGKGWTGKHKGVGWARKTLFEQILETAAPHDIILSLDADTRVQSDYCQAVGECFEKNDSLDALALPYYHPLCGQAEIDRAMLRYEMYMRFYHLNLQAISSPFAFTAIGSAMAFRVSALRRIGNIKPLPSGEDFYLLQKFCKTSKVSHFCNTVVMPATRLSSRVDFGTGPALAKACQGNWSSYPIYHPKYFAIIGDAYSLIEDIFNDKSLPQNEFLEFLAKQNKDEHLWIPLRKNLKDLAHFRQGFHEKADGLRILQFLKQTYNEKQSANTEKDSLQANLQLHLKEDFPYENLEEAPTEYLLSLREKLFDRELAIRKIQSNQQY